VGFCNTIACKCVSRDGIRAGGEFERETRDQSGIEHWSNETPKLSSLESCPWLLQCTLSFQKQSPPKSRLCESWLRPVVRKRRKLAKPQSA